MKPHTLAKHLFIPHAGNEYKPHFFRELSVGIIIAIVVFLLGFSAGSSFFIHKTVLGASVTASVLIDLTNESRLAFGEEVLSRNVQLDQAAQMKAEDMVRNGYFAHNSPEGITPWHWFDKAGYVFLYAGENLAVNFSDAVEVRDAWLDSPLHRANLLDLKFKEIGMATLSGEYKDGPTIYVVQMFGTPAAHTRADAKTVTDGESQGMTGDIAGTPEVKGEAASGSPYEPVVLTDRFAAVRSSAGEETDVASGNRTYAPWYGKLLFGGSYYVDAIYKALMLLVAGALVLMLVIEIRKQHWKHISYGLGLLLLLVLAILVNQTLF
jgi:hypothetical protein